MKTPAGFHELCSGLHQDAMIVAGGEITKLGFDCVEFVSKANRNDLRTFLAHVLSELSPAERKTLLKREKTAIVFRRPSRATDFLQAAFEALDLPGPR